LVGKVNSLPCSQIFIESQYSGKGGSRTGKIVSLVLEEVLTVVDKEAIYYGNQANGRSHPVKLRANV
jgi:hypothetical protein